MIKLNTPFGTYYLMQPQRIVGIGPAYKANSKYPVPTRPVILDSGQTIYLSDSDENMRALVGDDYVPDKPFEKPKRKKRVVIVEE